MREKNLKKARYVQVNIDTRYSLTKTILSFLRLQPKHCISDSLVDYKGYSNPSKGFLPTLVDIMVI